MSARLAELAQPPFSPPLWAWAIVGGLYYVLFFFLLVSLLRAAPTPTLTARALALVALLLAANAAWNWLFFRQRALALATAFYAPYALVAVALAVVLHRLRNPLRVWYSLYLVYLVYAGWWGIGLWRLNADRAPGG